MDLKVGENTVDQVASWEGESSGHEYGRELVAVRRGVESFHQRERDFQGAPWCKNREDPVHAFKDTWNTDGALQLTLNAGTSSRSPRYPAGCMYGREAETDRALQIPNMTSIPKQWHAGR